MFKYACVSMCVFKYACVSMCVHVYVCVGVCFFGLGTGLGLEVLNFSLSAPRCFEYVSPSRHAILFATFAVVSLVPPTVRSNRGQGRKIIQAVTFGASSRYSRSQHCTPLAPSKPFRRA